MHGRTKALAGAVAAVAVLIAAAPAGASFPGRNGRLVFADPSQSIKSNEPSKDALVTVRPDGTHRRVVVRMPGVTDAAWSADGRQIVFAARTVDRASAYNSYEIFTVRANGSHLRRLTHNSVADLSPSWSRSGHSIALVRVPYDKYYRPVYDSAELRLLNLDNGKERVVVHGSVREARLSPDSKLIAYTTGQDVFVVPPTGRNPMQVASMADAYLDGALAWETPFPDHPGVYGGTLLFTDYPNVGACDYCSTGVWAASNAEDAYFYRPHTPSDPSRITPWGAYSPWRATWSPNARRIDYCQPGGLVPVAHRGIHTYFAESWRLFTMKRDGTDAREVAPLLGCPTDWQPLPKKK